MYRRAQDRINDAASACLSSHRVQHFRTIRVTHSLGNMRFEFFCALILSVVVATFAGDKAAAPVDEKKDDGRFFVYSGTGVTFTTFTVLKTTTTTTSTFTTTTTCTTSTSALTTCTVGRRRRGLFYDEGANNGRNRRGLFYNDEEVENKEGSAFLPSAAKT